uniref:2-amino-3-carboxymuconate-6-semialdehyde decarboxylase n=1 Tax=Myxine glutinosa TaxID=7769 RepID=UPI00358F02E1
MKIDIHTHILPKELPDLTKRFGYEGWVTIGHHAHGEAKMLKGDEVFRVIRDNCWDPVCRLKDMEKTGVTMQVISTVPVMFNYWARPADTLELCKLLNEHLAGVAKQYPRRFAALGTLPMQSPMLAVDELRRCVLDLGLVGVEIGSHVNTWNLGSPELHPVYAEAEELGCAVFVHPWDMEVPEHMKKYWLPWLVGMPCETTSAICSMIFGGVFERFPKLKVCFAHGGGCFPYTHGRIEHGFRTRPDLCAVDNQVVPQSYLGRIYTDSLVHDEASLRLLLNVMNEDHVMLGSDYPFPLGEAEPGRLIESMDIAPDLKDKLQAGNALKFLGLCRDNLE